MWGLLATKIFQTIHLENKDTVIFTLVGGLEQFYFSIIHWE